jgi:hypothetical protein
MAALAGLEVPMLDYSTGRDLVCNIPVLSKHQKTHRNASANITANSANITKIGAKCAATTPTDVTLID